MVESPIRRLPIILVLLIVFSLPVFAAPQSVEFPGPPPGPARASQQGNTLTLENSVLSASWKTKSGHLVPETLTDKLSGTYISQDGAELFRLATKPTVQTTTPGLFVAVRLDAERVVALASPDGVSWNEIGSFPRSEFAGEPKVIRIGKMDLHAQAKDYSDPGPIGEGTISDLTPRPTTLTDGQFAFHTGANQAAVEEFPFPSSSKLITCRIDKGTDHGMSWGPALALIWDDGKKFLLVGVRDKTGTFNLTTADGETIRSMSMVAYPTFDLPASEFHLQSAPRLIRLNPDPHGTPLAQKIGGEAIDAYFVSDLGIYAHWRAELRDGSSYIRKTLELTSPLYTTPLYAVELTDVHVPDAKTIGFVPGCPVATGDFFFGVEIPGAQNALTDSEARIGFACQLTLSPEQPYTFGSVAGIAATGQLRRSFLYYLERERARPSKLFLHYNSWYDLGQGIDAAKLLDAAQKFHEELEVKRGVPVLSYLADDGWDDPSKGLWVENTDKFPGGFARLSAQMKRNGAQLSVWISPLGGYGGANERTDWARKMGLIPADSQLDLAQPAYKKWFQDRCLQLMREDGVNAFKWDRAGDGVSPHFLALLDIAGNLRKQNPNVFINVTVGTWPSPFWLNHIDSTWRTGSADVGWVGKGDDREKWITYRDGYCHKLFVEASPLYPLNSVMHHGIVQGREYQGAAVSRSGANLKNEARSYFATGTSLQELYITPSLMTPAAWDSVAEAAKWAHANADVLVDSHWVGGDPLKLEVYGYAAWNTRKGTLMLRNPDDKPQTITLDAQNVFELPKRAKQDYVLRSPYKDQRLQTLRLTGKIPQSVTLDPFEVLVFDAAPMPVSNRKSLERK